MVRMIMSIGRRPSGVSPQNSIITYQPVTSMEKFLKIWREHCSVTDRHCLSEVHNLLYITYSNPTPLTLIQSFSNNTGRWPEVWSLLRRRWSNRSVDFYFSGRTVTTHRTFQIKICTNRRIYGRKRGGYSIVSSNFSYPTSHFTLSALQRKDLSEQCF